MSGKKDNVHLVFDKKDPNYGGVSSLAVGTPGCGKTNALGRMCIEDYKKMRTVWRGKKTCQWTFFLDGGHPLVFWMPDDVDYQLLNRERKEPDRLEDYGEVRRYGDAEELVEGLQKGRINVVYARHGVANNEENLRFIDDWNEIFEAMTDRLYPNPISIYFIEFKDLAPESKAGYYERVTEYENKHKEFRKNWMHFSGEAHKETEIFWMVRDKIPWFIRMLGSKKDRNSKLYRGALQKLKVGEAYIEDDNRFDFIRFSLIGNPRNFVLKCKLKEI